MTRIWKFGDACSLHVRRNNGPTKPPLLRYMLKYPMQPTQDRKNYGRTTSSWDIGARPRFLKWEFTECWVWNWLSRVSPWGVFWRPIRCQRFQTAKHGQSCKRAYLGHFLAEGAGLIFILNEKQGNGLICILLDCFFPVARASGLYQRTSTLLDYMLRLLLRTDSRVDFFCLALSPPFDRTCLNPFSRSSIPADSFRYPIFSISWLIEAFK